MTASDPKVKWDQYVYEQGGTRGETTMLKLNTLTTELHLARTTTRLYVLYN